MALASAPVSLTSQVSEVATRVISLLIATNCIPAMAVAGSLRFFGFPEDAVTFIGASIGFMGAEKARDKVIAAFNRRVKEKDE